VALLTVGAVLGFVALARRAPAATALYAAIVWVFAAWLIPSHFSARIIARIAEVHDVSVDHRLVPDGDEINADGLRFRGTAEDLDPDDFVVLFLGDSFTYGLYLDYADAYPYAFETFVADGECRQPVRAVNFGWTSSSPLLSLRLLREIGYRYQPDLVVYNLDMTDFHDDLRYARELRQGGSNFSIDGAEIANVALNRVWPGEPIDVRRIFRIPEAPAPPDDQIALPEERFFVALQPLDETRDWIERGVAENLEALGAFADDVLGSGFAVVVYPRAFQYSRFESPRNWEEEKVERMGRHALEPFRYFDEQAAHLPYPVVSLLTAFQTSKRSPLFLTNDPHWTRFGAALAAETVARELGRLGLLPCELPGGAP
jgi:hypothetical protein